VAHWHELEHPGVIAAECDAQGCQRPLDECRIGHRPREGGQILSRSPWRHHLDRLEAISGPGDAHSLVELVDGPLFACHRSIVERVPTMADRSGEQETDRVV